MALANVVTTLLGVPLAWLVAFVLELVTTGGRAFGVASPVQMLVAVTLQAAWLVPYEGDLFWMVPAAATFLLIPCFVLSVIIERWVLHRLWPQADRRAVSTAVLRANTWSYLLLLVLGSLWLAMSIR